MRDVVITGVGCLHARAPAAAALAAWAAAPAALPALAPAAPAPAAPALSALPDPLPRPAAWACKAPRLARMDRFSQVAFLAAHEAYAAAGLAPRPPRPAAFGLVVGTAFGCHAVNEEFYRGLLRDGVRAASPRLFAATLPSSPAGELAIHCDARGPVLTLAQGWDAGLDAVAEAARLCDRGQADVVIAGGADVLSPTLLGLLAAWGYELDAAEGAVFVVVERAAAARARGAAPLAAVLGAGAAFAPSPGSAPARERAAAAALQQAGLPARAVARCLEAGAPRGAARGGAAGAGAPSPLAGLTVPVEEVAVRAGASFAAGGPLGVALALLGPSAGPTLVGASDPQGGAAALVLAPPD